MADKKHWIEIGIMPLVVALVGAAGTYFITQQQQDSADTRARADRDNILLRADADRESAERRATAERKIKLLEVFGQSLRVGSKNEQLAAIRMISTLDPSWAASLATALAANENQDDALRKKAEEVAVQSARDAINGYWVLRGENDPPDSVATGMELSLDRDGLNVIGQGWTGRGEFDGTNGSYSWTYESGVQGKTRFRLDQSGVMVGRVYGPEDNPELNWSFWASRMVRRDVLDDSLPRARR